MLLARVSEERPVMLRTDYFDEHDLRPPHGPPRPQHPDRRGRPDDAFTLTQLARGRMPSF